MDWAMEYNMLPINSLRHLSLNSKILYVGHKIRAINMHHILASNSGACCTGARQPIRLASISNPIAYPFTFISAQCRNNPHSGRIYWTLPTYILLSPGLCLHRFIYTWLSAVETLPMLENVRAMCLTWYMCGSCSVECCKHSDHKAHLHLYGLEQHGNLHSRTYSTNNALPRHWILPYNHQHNLCIQDTRDHSTAMTYLIPTREAMEPTQEEGNMLPSVDTIRWPNNLTDVVTAGTKANTSHEG